MALSYWITTACIGTVFVAFCFASPLRLFRLSRDSSGHLRRSFLHWYRQVYRDEDGEALDESDQPPRHRVGAQRFLIPAFAFGTLVFSVLDCALSALDQQHGLTVGGWVCFRSSNIAESHG